MNRFSALLLIILSLCFSSTGVSGQVIPKTECRNTVYANAGTLGLWFTASGNYERLLFSTEGKLHMAYFIRACGGAYATWGAEGPYGTLSIQAVSGSKKSHMEFGLGFGGLFDRTGYEIGVSNANYPYPGYQPEPTKLDYTDPTLAISLGYRYQRPAGGLMFRAGIGFPDGVYLLAGLAF